MSGEAFRVGETARDDLHLVSGLLLLEDEDVARRVVEQRELPAESLLCKKSDKFVLQDYKKIILNITKIAVKS